MPDYTPDVFAKIHKAEVSLSTREEMQQNFALVMQPYGNIEDLISPAPLSIALLGQLILVSLDTDVSLIGEDDPRPEYLTHASSLRASLLQVCHDGWDAFNLAHKNMDAIRLKTAIVPTHVTDATKIILSGTKDEMDIMLPKALQNINRIATDCTQKAQDVERKFVDVMQVISELLKLCTAKRGDHEREIRENKAALQAAELAKVQMSKEKEMAEENLKEMKDLLKQSREDYNTALEEMPSGVSIMFMSILEKAANTMIDVAQNVVNPVKTVVSTLSAIGNTVADMTGPVGPVLSNIAGAPPIPGIQKLSSTLGSLGSIIEALHGQLQAGKGKKAGTKGQEMEFLKAQTQRLMSGMKNQRESALSQSVSRGLEESLSLIEEVLNYESSLSHNPDDPQRMQQKARDLDSKVKKLSFQIGAQTANIPSSATPMKPTGATSSQSSVTSAVSLARMKCEQTSAVMKKSMDQYAAASKRSQEAMKEMATLVAQIARYELKELDFETIRKTLIEGISVMGKIKEQWSKLVQYFQMMSNIVECSLQESLRGFLEHAESGKELKMKNDEQYTLSRAMRDIIYLQASKANQISYLVQGLAETYVEVSAEYILRPLSGLDRLMALDADEDKGKIRKLQKELQRGAEAAIEAIKKIAQERQNNVLTKGYKRISQYEKIMREALPPPSAAEEKQLQELREAAAEPLSKPSVDVNGW